MNFSEQDGWVVSTMMLVGTSEQIRQSSSCKHEAWKELTRDTREGRILVMENCATCCATRAKVKPAAK